MQIFGTTTAPLWLPSVSSISFKKDDILSINFVIWGPAALVCAETLRQNCYQGRIIIVTKDSLPPFDKPKLSKVRNPPHGETNIHVFSVQLLTMLHCWVDFSLSYCWQPVSRCNFLLKCINCFRLWMWTAAASYSGQMTSISNMGLRCGRRKRWEEKILLLLCIKKNSQDPLFGYIN